SRLIYFGSEHPSISVPRYGGILFRPGNQESGPGQGRTSAAMSPDSIKSCHLVGVAGVGMNALAQGLIGGDWAVSGSDRYEDQGQDLEVIRKLKEAGVRFHPQDGSGVSASTGAVVVSSAIEPDNPDIAAATRLGVTVRHRAGMLAELVAGRPTVAIAGTSGKTTVTGMVGWILEQVGADPTVVNGGALVNWAGEHRIGNVRQGRSGLCVIEADESDRSLLQFHPDWALITNMSADHFSLGETEALFRQFRGQVGRDCIAGWECGVSLQDVKVRLGRAGSCFTYDGVEFELPLLGAHNVENALHAAILCRRMGYALGRIRDALGSFRGIERRLERVGEARGVVVVDEYAHNPAKIAAAWRAVAPHYKRVAAFWRPHGFKPLALMFEDLLGMFADVCRPQDRLFLLPVYYAGGTVSRQMDSDVLAAALKARGVSAEWMPGYEALMTTLVSESRPGDVVLCVGARDPGIPRFARDLVRRLAE
ncbi:MAG: Mur ligase family protein, partial [bacterium]